MFCQECGSDVPNTSAICLKCGVPTGTTSLPGTSTANSRTVYVLLGFFLGALGIHNFYAGYTTQAVIQLLITLFLGVFVIPIYIVWIWAIFEICTIKQDAQGVPFE